MRSINTPVRVSLRLRKTQTKARRIFVLRATIDPFQLTEWRNGRNGTDPTETAPGAEQGVSESEVGNI